MTGVKLNYPEPAFSALEAMMVFSLQLLSKRAKACSALVIVLHYPGLQRTDFIPPECANPNATFYTKLVITSAGPCTVASLSDAKLR